MITTARAWDCPYIWHAHAALGRDAGLPDVLVDAIRDGGALPDMAADERAVYDFGMELFQSRRVSPDTFTAVHELLGTQGLVELSTLYGFYTMLAFNANAVELDVPHDADEKASPRLAKVNRVRPRSRPVRSDADIPDPSLRSPTATRRFRAGLPLNSRGCPASGQSLNSHYAQCNSLHIRFSAY